MSKYTGTLSDFLVDRAKNTLIVYDLDKGNCSVTNDIDNVVKFLKKRYGELTGLKIIYRDSDRIFDQVVISPDGNVSIKSLNCTTVYTACEKVNTKN